MMKVPCRVMRGKSPMKMSFSMISPVSLLVRRALTVKGAAKVASRSRHSSSEYLGVPKGSDGTINSSFRFFPVKSSMGEISSKSSRNPSFLNHSKESSWIWIRPGIGRMSGMRANVTRSGSDTALLLTAIGCDLLSPSHPQGSVANASAEVARARCVRTDTKKREPTLERRPVLPGPQLKGLQRTKKTHQEQSYAPSSEMKRKRKKHTIMTMITMLPEMPCDACVEQRAMTRKVTALCLLSQAVTPAPYLAGCPRSSSTQAAMYPIHVPHLFTYTHIYTHLCTCHATKR